MTTRVHWGGREGEEEEEGGSSQAKIGPHQKSIRRNCVFLPFFPARLLTRRDGSPLLSHGMQMQRRRQGLVAKSLSLLSSSHYSSDHACPRTFNSNTRSMSLSSYRWLTASMPLSLSVPPFLPYPLSLLRPTPCCCYVCACLCRRRHRRRRCPIGNV